MKQIFDWLREQMEEAKYLIVPKGASSTYSSAETVVDMADIENLINEAEAKWESEVCEWKPSKYSYYIHKTSCRKEIEDMSYSWKYCPYCGKPIKISEVE